MTLTGFLPSVGTRAQYFRASLIFLAKTVFVDKINLDDGCQVASTALASTTQHFDLLPPMKGYLVTQVFYFGLVVNPAAALTLAIRFVS